MPSKRYLISGIREKYRRWRIKNEAKFKEYSLMLYAFKKSPVSVAGLVIVIFFVVIGVLGPYILELIKYIVGYLHSIGWIDKLPKFNAYDYSYDVLKPPSHLHWFGTDDYGRDLFARVMLGMQISLYYSVVVIVFGVPIGVILGLIAGYYGGKIDETISRITDMFLAFPALVLAMALAASLGAGLESAIIAMIVVWWPGYVRLVRGQVLSIKENQYVEAARAVGMRDSRIIIKHILPQVFTPLIIFVTLDLAAVILLGASLSFIGLGAQPPLPELGRLVYDGLDYLPNKWWYSLIPGFILFMIALGFNLLGDGLRDVFDPRYRRQLEFKKKGKEESESE